MTPEEQKAALIKCLADEIFRQGTTINATTASTAAARAVTYDEIRSSMEKLDAHFRNLDEASRSARQAMQRFDDVAGGLFGVPVTRSPYAVQLVPNRVHKRRHHQSLAYHLRVQKKWTKRWGTFAKPAIFMIGAQAGLLGNQAHLIVHDEIYDQVKRSP